MQLRLLSDLIAIILINVVLSGDNAVVIALAVNALPRPLRTRALIAGSACAIAILVVATLLATGLVRMRFLRLAGGVLILWISLSPFREATLQRRGEMRVPSLWKAIWVIIAADLVMSTDNILAVAAVAQGRVFLLLFGLSFSIPIVVLGSGAIADLLDKHPAVIYVTGALLGRIGGEMIVTDTFVTKAFAPSALVRYGIETLGALTVPVAGLWLQTRIRRRRVGDLSHLEGCHEIQP